MLYRTDLPITCLHKCLSTSDVHRDPFTVVFLICWHQWVMNQPHGNIFLWITLLCYCKQVRINFWRPADLILVKGDQETWALLATCKISTNKQPTEKCLCVYCFWWNNSNNFVQEWAPRIKFFYNSPIFCSFGTPSLATTDIRYLT